MVHNDIFSTLANVFAVPTNTVDQFLAIFPLLNTTQVGQHNEAE